MAVSLIPGNQVKGVPSLRRTPGPEARTKPVSGRRGPRGSPPPTPPCVRFLTRRVMQTAGSGASGRWAGSAQEIERRMSAPPVSCGSPRRSTRGYARWWPMAMPGRAPARAASVYSR